MLDETLPGGVCEYWLPGELHCSGEEGVADAHTIPPIACGLRAAAMAIATSTAATPATIITPNRYDLGKMLLPLDQIGILSSKNYATYMQHIF